jgi:transposase
LRFCLGIDIACRAPHQGSLADDRGQFVWSGKRFRTTTGDLEALWALLPAGTEPGDVTVVMEPTRNAWAPLAAWFRRRGAVVVMVPSERSSDLRDYYRKHTKTDRLDSRMLARLPLLHPEGLHPEEGLGPADTLKRTAKLRSTLMKRRGQCLARLDSMLELLGPGWDAALGGDLAKMTPLRFLAAGYADPHVVRRLGRARLSRFIYRHSRGAWGDDMAVALLAAADSTLALWAGELDYSELSEDIAIEARLALQLTTEVKELDERVGVHMAKLDVNHILESAPGVGPVVAAAVLGRLGDPNRFRSLAGVRAFSGLVPSLDSSGIARAQGGPTKRGDAVLREALFMAADQARRQDPTLAARYHRLITEAGKHHNSALCHVATTLLSRIVTCWRNQEPYQLRDVDGRPVTKEEAKAIIAERYRISAEVRRQRRTVTNTHRIKKGRAGRRKESQSAPSAGPSRPRLEARIRG